MINSATSAPAAVMVAGAFLRSPLAGQLAVLVVGLSMVSLALWGVGWYHRALRAESALLRLARARTEFAPAKTIVAPAYWAPRAERIPRNKYVTIASSPWIVGRSDRL